MSNVLCFNKHAENLPCLCCFRDKRGNDYYIKKFGREAEEAGFRKNLVSMTLYEQTFCVCDTPALLSNLRFGK